MARRAWTTTELRDIVRRLSAGETPETVAASIGRTLNAMRCGLYAQGIDYGGLLRRGRRSLHRPHVLAFLRREITADEAAKRCGYASARGFYRMLERERVRWDRERDYLALTLAQEREAHHLHHEHGMSFRALGARYGVHHRTVRRSIERFQERLAGKRHVMDPGALLKGSRFQQDSSYA